VPVPEAPFRNTKYGLVADVEGWFILNARESRWRDYGPLGVTCNFEGKRSFRQMGINVNILEPGQPLGLYHRENHQEGFLVLSGECLLIVEGEERRLRAWDLFHCPGGTAHVLVGPSVVVAVGARGGRKGLHYLVDAAALSHAAGIDEETKEYAEAYRRFPPPTRTRYREGWLPDQP
jgi:mannose-6-phosphate isomerase-like protein (cupin superfamily)